MSSNMFPYRWDTLYQWVNLAPIFLDTKYFQLHMGLRSFQKLEFWKSIIFIFPDKKLPYIEIMD